jgi:hypothetical protein
MALSSLPVQQPSPHCSGQSAEQLHAVSDPEQQPSPHW